MAQPYDVRLDHLYISRHSTRRLHYICDGSAFHGSRTDRHDLYLRHALLAADLHSAAPGSVRTGRGAVSRPAPPGDPAGGPRPLTRYGGTVELRELVQGELHRFHGPKDRCG